MFGRRLDFLAVIAALFALAPLNAQEPKKDASAPKKEAAKGYEETILDHFKKPTDTASLFAYLKEKSASDDALLAIPELIKQLGSEKFTERQAASKKLLALGLPAFMPLLDAMNDRDAERAQLAKATIEKMDRGTHTVAVPPVTIRMLMKRKPPELLEVLLRYLPYTTDPEVEEDLYYDIDELAIVSGKVNRVLVKALEDKLPARRAIAGCILARAGTAEQKLAARKLLNDADSNVRLRTAQGFLAGLAKTGIPTLIELLDGKPVSFAWQAEELLVWMAGDAAPKELVWSGDERAKKAKAAWQKWWEENEAKVDLQKVEKLGRVPCLLRGESGGYFVGGDGRIRWLFKPSNARFKHYTLLPNDRLVALKITAASPLDFQDDLYLYGATLDGTILRETKLTREFRFTSTYHALNANGVVCYFSPGVIASAGLEGKVLARVQTADATKLSTIGDIAAPTGSSDGLVWIAFMRGTEKATLLMDPQDGAIVNRWTWPNHKAFSDLTAVFDCSRGRVLIASTTAVWSYDFSEFRRVCQLDVAKYESVFAICPLRGHGFAVDDGRNIVFYSSEWKVLSASRNEASFPRGIINHFLPVVSFGFR